MKSRVLFVLKFRETSGGYSVSSMSSGLFNSANFVVKMLNKNGIETKLVQVIDNNSIDKEVSIFKPTHVIIEALWVVPEKFEVLIRLHPHVKWIIRGHSEMPFLAQEGIAIDWISRYVKFKNVVFAANSIESVNDLRSVIQSKNSYWSASKVNDKVVYLPNWYPYHLENEHQPTFNGIIDIACFGAIRPLKNQLIQALTAIRYSDILSKSLRFHMNTTRVEQQGDSVLKNIKAMFKDTRHTLVEHPWYRHNEFLAVLRTMDMAMQVSFSETFNIVAADCVITRLPIVASREVSWISPLSQADPTSSDNILFKMFQINNWKYRLLTKKLNYIGLRNYSEDSKKKWLDYIR